MGKTLTDDTLKWTLDVNGKPAMKELNQVEQATKQLEKTNKDLRVEMQKMEANGKKNTQEYKNLATQIKANNATIGVNKAKMGQLRSELGLTSLTSKQLRQEYSRLKNQMDNTTPGTKEWKKLQGELNAVSGRMNELRITGTRTNRMFGKFKELLPALGITGGVYMAIGALKSWGSKMQQYSDQIADVRKTTGLTKKEVKELTEEFGNLSTRTSREELMLLAVEAGRLGKKSKKDVMDFVEVANQIKIALGDDLGGNAEEAIREVGKLTTIYKIGEAYGTGYKESMLKVGSAINEVSANSQAMAPFLIETLKRMGGLATQAGIMADDVIGYGSALDQLGQRTEMSSTALNKVILNMFTDTSTYAEIAKVDLQEFTELLNTDANEAFLKVLEGLNGNNDGLAVMGEKLQGLGLDGSRAVQVLASLASNTEMVRKEQALANKAITEGTSLTDEYNVKNNTLAGSVEKLSSAWDRLVLALSKSEGAYKKGTDLLSKFLDDMTGLFINDDKNLDHFKLNQEQYANISAFNQVRLGGIATELIKKQAEVRSQDEVSLGDWISYYQVKIDQLEGSESAYSNAKKELYAKQIEELQGFIDEKKKLTNKGGEGAETPEQKVARLAAEAAQKQAEISVKTRELFMSDLEVKLRAINVQADKLREEGIAEVDIARWVAIEKKKIEDSFLKEKKPFDPTKLAAPELEYEQFKANELKKYREAGLKGIEDNYNREKILDETQYNNEMAALGDNEEAKLALTDKYNAEQLQKTVLFLNTLKIVLETIREVGLDANGAMLSDEDKTKLDDQIAGLDLALSKIIPLVEGDNDSGIGEIERYLFGIDQGDSLTQKIAKIGQFAITTFSKINQIISNGEQKQLQDYQRANEDKKKALESRLNSGEMSQEQYNTAVGALDDELAKKQRKVAHDQAVRAKAIAVMQTIVNTAAGVAAQLSIPGAGIGLAIAAAAMGAIEIAIAASTPVPALAAGNRQKILADDGKTYNARVAPKNRNAQIFSEPTFIPGLGLVGETNQPELVFNPAETQALLNSPALIDAINMTLGSTPQYAQGNSREIIRENNTVTTSTMDDETKALLADIRNKLAEPSQAILVADENYIRTHKKKVTEYDTFKSRVSG